MGQTVGLIIFYVAIFAVMYFIFIRPQRKKATETQKMLDEIKPGDHVVTIGGLHGIVDEVNTAENTIVIDCEGVFLTFEKRAISRVSNVATVSTRDGIIEDTDPDDAFKDQNDSEKKAEDDGKDSKAEKDSKE